MQESFERVARPRALRRYFSLLGGGALASVSALAACGSDPASPAAGGAGSGAVAGLPSNGGSFGLAGSGGGAPAGNASSGGGAGGAGAAGGQLPATAGA